MDLSVKFDKLEYKEFEVFVCKDSGWQLSKELGFHKSSPARDYLVKWVEKNGKWVLYLTDYGNHGPNESIVTVDTIFDVFDYMCKNKNIHY